MKRFAVVGSNIGYSLSPKIHTAVFRRLNVNAKYVIEDLPIGGLADNIERLLSEYDGFNVTVPFKKEIIKYINSDEFAVNTVDCNTKIGYNTDKVGFRQDIMRLIGSDKGLNAVVLGAGGSAETVVRELLLLCSSVAVIARNAEKATALAGATGADVVLKNAPELIVNCTPLGWDGVTNALPQNLPLEKLRYAYDLTYPIKGSPFLFQAVALGATTRNGLGMLVYQAVAADSIFLKTSIESDIAEQILAEIISEQRGNMI